MKRLSRRSLIKLASALAASAWVGNRAFQKPMLPPRFVLALCVDCLRADEVGVYGCPIPTTPCIDGFARQAVIFENVYANSNWTKPSVASFFTGLWPGEHGAIAAAGPAGHAAARDLSLPEGIPTLAAVYRERGFRTGGFVWQPNLLKEFGFAQGFETYDIGTYDAGQIASRFEAWYQTLGRDERAFAYLHFLDCHAPYPEHLPYSQQFGSTSRAFLSCPEWQKPGAWSAFRDEVNSGKRTMPRDQGADLFNRYRGDVRFVDNTIGGIISMLQTAGVLDDSLVCVFGDHGEDFLEHGTLGHDPPFFFEEQIRIPMIVKFPASWDIAPGRRSRERQTIDLTATLAAAVGRTGFGHGRDLVDPADASRPAYIITQSAQGVTVVKDGLKAYVSIEGALPQVREAFDVRRDGAETREISASAPGFVGAVESYMKDWRESTARVYASFGNRKPGAQPSPKDIEALRALGYLR